MNHVHLKTKSKDPLVIVPSSIDAQAIFERAKFFKKRSLKSDSKMRALYLAISMIDLTTLEGSDTTHKVLSLCARAKSPVSKLKHLELVGTNTKSLPLIPKVAAVCVYPEQILTAKKFLKSSGVEIASVSTAFPSGQIKQELKEQEVLSCLSLGASEIDMVINRGAFLAGDYQKVFDEIQAIAQICRDRAHLKVILETGEIGSFEKINLASQIAMHAGADFIKTSTGKISNAASLPATLVMFESIWDFYKLTGKKIGMKPAGGIRTSKDAISYLCMLYETLGNSWLTPDLFRFGASSLLNDLLKQIYKQHTGHYFDQDSFSQD
ncbi:deoxyribose-phosphate aldolase [bacterium]|nr:deoxyribose-phosphate aldolase [bacterium]